MARIGRTKFKFAACNYSLFVCHAFLLQFLHALPTYHYRKDLKLSLIIFPRVKVFTRNTQAKSEKKRLKLEMNSLTLEFVQHILSILGITVYFP